jgi:uncharacterized membrane protein HdeD (DUF308 family)
MSMNEPDLERIERAVAPALHKYWMLFLLEGIILVILGLAAIIVPRTLAMQFSFGWLFLISGITGLATTILRREVPGFFWSLVSAILGIVAGILLLLSPTQVLSLTVILILFFLIEGVASIMFALDHKREQVGQWGWMLVSGIIDLNLAAVVLFGLPGSAKWALGLLVGVNLISGGVALVATAVHARAISSGPAAAAN